jgi:diacylglycerol kinase (ATP)
MKRFIRSVEFAIKGWRAALQGQPNLQIHLAITVLVVIAGIILNVSTTDWSILLLCIGLVISAELFNTAIEKLVDIVSPEWSERAGKIKDISAAAVLTASVIALIIGLITFGKYL